VSVKNGDVEPNYFEELWVFVEEILDPDNNDTQHPTHNTQHPTQTFPTGTGDHL
jgi:hypothetical protein